MDNKNYIGFTNKINPIDRWKKHIRAAINNCKYILHRAIRKYGLENFTFEILYQSTDKFYTLTHMENYFINEYDSFKPNGYNMTMGGEGTVGRFHSEETKRKIGVKSSQRIDSPKTIKLKSEYLISNNPSRGKFGENNSNSKQYKITFKNGTNITITGLQNFANTNGYKRRVLYRLIHNKISYYKGITKVEKIS